MITVVDYKMGNVASVVNAFTGLGCDAIVTNRPEDIEKAERIVLPGVGAFAEGMANLRELGLIDVLHREVRVKKKPFLGICVGMQLLAEEGEEFGLNSGLGWIPGRVIRLNTDDLVLPHVGWNNVAQIRQHALFEGIPDGSDFYFVHSFHLRAANPSHIMGTCEYGEHFAAAVAVDNMIGVQFHPEKSQKAGRRLLENFVKRP